MAEKELTPPVAGCSCRPATDDKEQVAAAIKGDYQGEFRHLIRFMLHQGLANQSLEPEQVLVASIASPHCGHRVCHDERLLKLEVRIIRLGRIGLREILRRLARDRPSDRWQIGALPSPDIRCATLVLQHMVQISLVFGIEIGASSRVSATSTSGAMPSP